MRHVNTHREHTCTPAHYIILFLFLADRSRMSSCSPCTSKFLPYWDAFQLSTFVKSGYLSSHSLIQPDHSPLPSLINKVLTRGFCKLPPFTFPFTMFYKHLQIIQHKSHNASPLFIISLKQHATMSFILSTLHVQCINNYWPALTDNILAAIIFFISTPHCVLFHTYF